MRNELRDGGWTILQLLVIVAIIGMLATIAVPQMACHIQRSKYSSAMNDLMKARDAIELFEIEHDRFPVSLEEAFGENRRVPDTIRYCIDEEDDDKGHGNNKCTFFDSDNPSGNNEHGGTPGIGYLLATMEDICPCQDVNVAWISCCGREPQVVPTGEDFKMGHPGGAF